MEKRGARISRTAVHSFGRTSRLYRMRLTTVRHSISVFTFDLRQFSWTLLQLLSGVTCSDMKHDLAELCHVFLKIPGMHNTHFQIGRSTYASIFLPMILVIELDWRI
jgi:hypothetical protein